jgi:lipid-A-disaccharide synthase
VDAPDFNLGLEARLKAAGIKSIHFICPSIWAWRGGRARKMAQAVDHVLCLFPFEPALLQAHGVAATFVGHPLADAIPLQVPRAASRAQLGLAKGDTVVALLPGSRRSEIQYIAPAFLQPWPCCTASGPHCASCCQVGARPLLKLLAARHAPGVLLQWL